MVLFHHTNFAFGLESLSSHLLPTKQTGIVDSTSEAPPTDVLGRSFNATFRGLNVSHYYYLLGGLALKQNRFKPK